MIRILIVEDHEVVRDALANLLGDAPDMEVIATACSVRDALPLLDKHRPQIVLTDLALEDGSGMELVRALRRSRRKGRVVVLTGHCDVFTAKKTLAEGVAGYVLKSQASSELLDAIRTVAMRHPLRRPGNCGEARERRSTRETEALSRREHDVFRQLVSGYKSEDIARHLSISLKTVETHRASINRKLAVTTTADLIRFAVASGMPVVPRISSARADLRLARLRRAPATVFGHSSAACIHRRGAQLESTMETRRRAWRGGGAISSWWGRQPAASMR